MMRTDSKGRSASPHRITYKTDFHAIKCSFDTGTTLQPGTKAAAAQRSAVHSTRLLSSLSDPIMSHTSTGSRGRVRSTRGTKIRDNIFLQMDSQQLKQDGGPVLSSGPTPLLSPHNPSPQLQTSPFSGSRHSIVSSSSVPSTVANSSTPASSLQDKLSRSEEIADIDRAALAQKFSVTRRLFETKVTEVEGGGGQVLKGITSRGSKGMADGQGEEEEGRGGVSQVEKWEETSGKSKHPEEDSFDRDKSINPPIINISSPQPPAQALLTRHPKSPVSDGPSEASNTSPSYLDKQGQSTGSQTNKERPESATLELCLTPEEPVRAELVDLKNESSESDENEEEKGRKEAENWLKDEWEKYTKKVAGESEQDLVDDVFEGPCMETRPYELENRVDIRSGDGRPVVPSEEYQRELSASMSCKRETKDDGEGGEDKYRQVTEQWEGQRSHLIALAEKSTEKGEYGEKKTDEGVEESAGRTERGMMQEDDTDKKDTLCSVGKKKEWKQSQEEERIEEEEKSEKEELQEEHVNEEVKREECREDGDGKDHAGGGKEDQPESAAACGIENEAFVYEQESQTHSVSPRQEWENSTPGGNQLLSEYEEIPGVPEVDDQEDEDAAEVVKRKVRFSSAPIKVRKPLGKNNTSAGFQHSLFTSLTAAGSLISTFMHFTGALHRRFV